MMIVFLGQTVEYTKNGLFMNDFPARFAEMMAALKLSKNADFARLLGVEQQNVHNWVKVRQRIGTDSRLLFQEKTGISFDWLNDGIGSMWLPSREHPHETYPYPATSQAPAFSRRVRDSNQEYRGTAQSGYIRFGLMEGTASAGYGSVNDDFPEVLRSIDIAEWQVRQQLGFIPTDNRVQLLTVRGNSNYPKIKNGDVVMVDTSQITYAGDDFYLINLHGYTLIKRLQIMGDGLHIRSTNPEYESEVVPAKMMGELIIAGRILGLAQFRRSEEI